jgi:hypothetical protein
MDVLHLSLFVIQIKIKSTHVRRAQIFIVDCPVIRISLKCYVKKNALMNIAVNTPIA